MTDHKPGFAELPPREFRKTLHDYDPNREVAELERRIDAALALADQWVDRAESYLRRLQGLSSPGQQALFEAEENVRRAKARRDDLRRVLGP